MSFSQWDAAFAAFPADTDVGSITDDAFVDLKYGIKQTLQKELYFDWLADGSIPGDTPSASIARQGMFKPGSGRTFFYEGADINNVAGIPYGTATLDRWSGQGRQAIWIKTTDNSFHRMVLLWCQWKSPNNTWALRWVKMPQGEIGDVKWVSGSVLMDLTDPLNPLVNPHTGYVIADGVIKNFAVLVNGNTYNYAITPLNLQDKFIKSETNVANVGQTGGNSSLTLVKANLPPHGHSIDSSGVGLNINAGGLHAHQIAVVVTQIAGGNSGVNGAIAAGGNGFVTDTGIRFSTNNNVSDGSHSHTGSVTGFPAATRVTDESNVAFANTAISILPSYYKLLALVRVW